MQGEGARGEGARGEAAEGGRGAARGVLSGEHDHRWVLHLAGNTFRRSRRWHFPFPLPRPFHFLPIPHPTALRYVVGEPIPAVGNALAEEIRKADGRALYEHLDVASEGEDFEAETKEGYDRLIAVPQTGPWLGMKARPRRRRCASTSRAAPRWGAWRRAR